MREDLPPPHRYFFAVSSDGENWRQPLELHYDLGRPVDDQLRFKDLYNYFIHSFAFEVRLTANEDDVEILFNSDHTAAEALYLIALSDYLRILRGVEADETAWIDTHMAEGRVTRRRTRPKSR